MSQSILPGNFSVNGLSAIERRRLEYYYEQYVVRRSYLYGEGHFILACYAALPVVLTPDLLYKIWLNFKNYCFDDKSAVIHPVAPADLLLSPLVEEIGNELYEMPDNIRQVLMLHLKKITGEGEPNPLQLYSLTEIACFLHSYAQYDFTPANADDYAFREAQIWTALSYLDPGYAFGQVVNKYKEANNSAEQVRYSNALERMSRRFALDIVRDPALIPPAHKAVTALTSVMKDVFNDRDAAKLAELQQAIQASDGKLLTGEPLLQENIINIEIDELMTARLGNKQKKQGQKKLRALVVGVSRSQPVPFEMACEEGAKLFVRLMHDEITSAEQVYETELLIGRYATKQAILDAWNTIIEKADRDDDLLFYLAGDAIDFDGHCYVTCADSGELLDKRFWLADDEIGQIANSKRVASITIIIQTDHAATEYWLDTSRNGNVVFAACKYGQQPLYYSPSPNGRFVCGFTVALEKVLRESRMQITNRALFLKILQYYATELQLGNDDYLTMRREHSPVLLCNVNSFDLFITQGNNKLVALQTQLRSTGFYNKAITGDWDVDTAQALGRFVRASGLPADLSKQQYIDLLLEQRKLRFNEHPIFLLIFSDPDEKLPEMKREQKGILDELYDPILSYRPHIRALHNPDINDLKEYFSDPINRNRIQLVYYSGFDKNGDYILKDGTFTLTEFAALLDYQQNIQLFISNTCRSEYFAEYVCKLGVPQAIGVKDEVSDREGADFGIELFKMIIDGHALEEMLQLNPTILGEKNGFVLFKNDPNASLPWQFKMTTAKRKIFLSYAYNDRELVKVLKGGIESVMSNVEVSDETAINSGESWQGRIEAEIAGADLFIICISPNYLASKYCLEELEVIQQKAVKSIIPIYVDRISDIEQIPELSNRQFFTLPFDMAVLGRSSTALTDFVHTDKKGNITGGIDFERYLQGLGEAIEKSLVEKKDATVYVARDGFPVFEKKFIGRNELLQQIDQQLSPERPLVLSGIGGMGKTTAAIAYCRDPQYASKCKYVIWADGSEGILDGVGKALVASPEIKERFDESHLYIQDALARGAGLDFLQLLPGNNLLVIDNANDLSNLQGFINSWIEHKMETKCLVITRCDISRGNNIIVGPLSLTEATNLFTTFYQDAFHEESFRDIYNYINGNVLLVELLAKFADRFYPRIENTDQLLVYLKSNGITSLDGDLEISGITWDTNLYDPQSLPENQINLLRHLSLFPARAFPNRVFYNVLEAPQVESESLENEMNSLAQNGWLERTSESYKMTFIVKEICRKKLKPDIENCNLLVSLLRIALDKLSAEDENDFIEIGLSVVSEIGIASSAASLLELAGLEMSLGESLMKGQRLGEALRVVNRAIEIFSSSAESIDDYINALQLAGEICYKQGNWDTCLKYLNESRSLLQARVDAGGASESYSLKLITIIRTVAQVHRSRKYFEEALREYGIALDLADYGFERGRRFKGVRLMLVVDCNLDLGALYHEIRDLSKSLEYLNAGCDWLKEAFGEDHDNAEIVIKLLNCLQRITLVCTDMRDWKTAISHCTESISIAQDLLNRFPDSSRYKALLANSYQYMAMIHREQQQLDKAVKFAEDNLMLVRELHHAEPNRLDIYSSLATSYAYLGNILREKKDIEKAENFLMLAMAIRKSLNETEPENLSYEEALAFCWQDLGLLYEAKGDNAKAYGNFLIYSEGLKDLLKRDTQNNIYKNWLACSYMWLGRNINDTPSARTYFQMARDIWKELLNVEPGIESHKYNIKWAETSIKD